MFPVPASDAEQPPDATLPTPHLTVEQVPPPTTTIGVPLIVILPVDWLIAIPSPAVICVTIFPWYVVAEKVFADKPFVKIVGPVTVPPVNVWPPPLAV